jgi:hypothetical protein
MKIDFQMNKKNDSDLAVFTVCNIAYLPKALVLADSLTLHHQTRLKVVLFDKKQELNPHPTTIDITWLEDLGFSEWRQLAFTYDIIEFSTSLKPFISLKLLETHGKVIFLDPDTAVYSSLVPIEQELENHPVVLTPHYLQPQPDTEAESDLGMMRFGSFNLGFFAVRQGEQAMNFLNWWHRRCVGFCFMESQFGLSTDQKWVSIAPCFFDFLKISFNPGYNAAAWNTFERRLTSRQGDHYWINGDFPLVFFHFSNFDHDDPQYLNKRASCESGVRYEFLEELGLDYSSKLKKYECAFVCLPYTYDYMSDGSYISPTLRRAYESVRMLLPPDTDPFDVTGPVGDFAYKNRLLTKGKQVRYRYPGLRDAKNNSKKLAVIYWVMRLILRIFGPNRFYDISKLMVFLSIYRKKHNYWRL